MNHYVESFLGNTVYKALSMESILTYMRGRRLRGKAVVLRYHELADDHEEVDAWTIVKKSDFIRQMEYVAAHFTVLSLKDAFDRLLDPAGEHETEKPIAVITFDDGYERNRSLLLPIAESLHLPVTIFIATQSVQDGTLYWDARVINALQGKRAIMVDLEDLSLGKFAINSTEGPDKWREMDALLARLKGLAPELRKRAVERILDQLDRPDHTRPTAFSALSLTDLRRLSACPLISLEAHSHCHSILTQISDEKIRESVQTSRQLLESWTGRRVNFFAYPNGDYDQRVINVVKGLGFEGSVITKARPWGRDEEPFAIPRVGIGRYDNFDTFKLKASSGGVRSLLSIGKN